MMRRCVVEYACFASNFRIQITINIKASQPRKTERDRRIFSSSPKTSRCMFAISASILLSDSAALLKSILYQSHVSVRSVGRKKSSGQEHAAIKNLKRSPARRSCVAPRLRRRRTTCSSKHTMPNRLVCRVGDVARPGLETEAAESAWVALRGQYIFEGTPIFRNCFYYPCNNR